MNDVTATQRYGENQVRAGMKLLDATKPGWRKLINLETLDLALDDQCVLGQAYGYYNWGRNELFPRHGMNNPNEQARDHGFFVGDNNVVEVADWELDGPDIKTGDRYLALTATWRELLKDDTAEMD